MFCKGDYVFTFGLKSAYHHIAIFPDHRTYLGFSCDFSGTQRYFVFNVLPFGLSTAGYIFSKVTRVLVKLWRSEGRKVIMYLDDRLAGHADKDKSFIFSKTIRTGLFRFGFLVAEEKCIWEANKNSVWLGLFWNMFEGKVYITDKRITKLTSSLRKLLDSVSVGFLMLSARELACIIGQIISMKVVIGNVVRLMTRSMYASVLSRSSWNSRVYLTE